MMLEDREMAQIAQLRAALAGDMEADRRFRAASLLAGLLGHRLRAADAADVLEDQLEALAERPDLQRATEAALVNVTRIDPATRARAAGAIERLRRRVDGGEERDPAVLGTIATEMAMAGEPAVRTAEVAARAVVGTHATDISAQDWSWYGALRALVAAEGFDTALRELDRALDRARERGAAIDAGAALTVRADLLLRTGKLARAEATALALREIAARCGLPVGDRYAVACLGEVLIERGRLDEAERLLMDGPLAAPTPAVATTSVLLARGRLRLAQGRAAEAVAELRECGARAEAIGIVNPALVPWRSRLAEALLELGEVAEARRLAAAELADARRFGAPRAIGIALRVAARAAAATRRSGCCARPSRSSTARRRAWSTPAPVPRWAPRCGSPATPRRPGNCSAPPSTWRTAAAPPRWRSRRWWSCGRRAPVLAGA